MPTHRRQPRPAGIWGESVSDADEIIKKIAACLEGKAEFALVYGSILTERFNNESDIDIAVFPKKKWRRQPMDWRLSRALAEATNREVDVLYLDSADPIIIMQVLANGKPVVMSNPQAFLSFKARKISEYLDLKRSRQVVEDHLMRGKLDA